MEETLPLERVYLANFVFLINNLAIAESVVLILTSNQTANHVYQHDYASVAVLYAFVVDIVT